VKVLGIDLSLQVDGYAHLETDGNRGRCPRTPGILRFWPAAWLKSKAMPACGRHRPCHWTAAALGVLASRALTSTAATPEHLQHLTAARGKSNVSLLLLAQSDKCRGLGGQSPQGEKALKNRTTPTYRLPFTICHFRSVAD